MVKRKYYEPSPNITLPDAIVPPSHVNMLCKVEIKAFYFLQQFSCVLS